MMVISRPVPKVAYLLQLLVAAGYHTIRPFPFDSPASTDAAKSLWENSFLAVADSQPLEEEDKSAEWVCYMCDRLSGTCFDEFMTHLSSQEHADRIPVFIPKYPENTMIKEYEKEFADVEDADDEEDSNEEDAIIKFSDDDFSYDEGDADDFEEEEYEEEEEEDEDADEEAYKARAGGPGPHAMDEDAPPAPGSGGPKIEEVD
ncbi:PREDICTED: nucleolar transcription factor 1-A-like [Camelina sativa]|uniref:Nucleolar transcription factor 1-A-like n=1 Tax=Camelina sativa TaxID=90675 RepID=A0ABM0XT58_CAMSA|nr:PREDICTED: nucleolar transcription factor 1-A-like [Camelina sativa]